MSATDALLERESESARLAALIGAARAGRGGVAVIEGPAGIGKTTLLRHAVALADDMTVLTASGSELEHEFGFGVVRQLLERAAADRLEGAAALAAPALGVPAPLTASPPSAPADARFAALHGLYWLVANLAADAPLLLAVDDAQWATSRACASWPTWPGGCGSCRSRSWSPRGPRCRARTGRCSRRSRPRPRRSLRRR